MTETRPYAAAMREALALAARGRFRVEPNPTVGAVVLGVDGRTLGRGFHAAYGAPHAEVDALRDAGGAARGATVVTTLEPCAHTAKKTPPCVDALLAAGVGRVVIGAPDPNPATSGRAAEILRTAGIDVVEGIEREACESAVMRYAEHLVAALPWTLAKWAMTADGRTADARGASRWISGPISRALVHELRGRVEAVIVGPGTVGVDDPRLTARDAAPSGLPAARRVVIDSRLRAPSDRRVFTDARTAPTWVLCTAAAPREKRHVLEAMGVVVETVAAGPDGRTDLPAAFARLRELGVRRALLESGPGLTGAALRAGVVQQITAFTAPVIVGGEGAPSPFAGHGWNMADAPRLLHPRASACGDDALLEGYWPSPL